MEEQKHAGLSFEVVLQRLAEHRKTIRPTGLFPNDSNVARPPPIPEYISKRSNTKKDKRNPSAPKGKDANAYFNVLREVGNYVREHNQEHANDPKMQYRWYDADLEDKRRIETLMRIVDDLAPGILGPLYGKMTYEKIHRTMPHHLELLVYEVALDENFDPLTQGVRLFPARKIVSAKLFSKRKAAKAAEKKKNCDSGSVKPSEGTQGVTHTHSDIRPSLDGICSNDVENADAVSVVPDLPTEITAAHNAASWERTRSDRSNYAPIPSQNANTRSAVQPRQQYDQHELHPSTEYRGMRPESEPTARNCNQSRSAGNTPLSTLDVITLKTPKQNDKVAGDQMRQSLSSMMASRLRVNPLVRNRKIGNNVAKEMGQKAGPNRSEKKKVKNITSSQRTKEIVPKRFSKSPETYEKKSAKQKNPPSQVIKQLTTSKQVPKGHDKDELYSEFLKWMNQRKQQSSPKNPNAESASTSKSLLGKRKRQIEDESTSSSESAQSVEV